jgi:hypothetical protein
MRFLEIDGEVAIKRLGERCRLIRSAGQDSFRDHRIENVIHANSDRTQEVEVEFGVVKYLDDRFIRKKLS